MMWGASSGYTRRRMGEVKKVLMSRAKKLTCATYPNNIHEGFDIGSEFIVSRVPRGVIMISAFITEFLRISSRDSQYFIIQVVYQDNLFL